MNDEDNQPYSIDVQKPAQGIDFAIGAMGKTHNPTSCSPIPFYIGMERKTSAGDLQNIPSFEGQRQHNLVQNVFEVNAKNRSYSQYRNFENRLTVRRFVNLLERRKQRSIG